MEQLNISQLRNLWLRSPDERLAGWRTFRIELQALYEQHKAEETELLRCLDSVALWWEQCPLVSVAIDPFDAQKWPTVWEIIDGGECCKYSRGLAMAYNLHYMDPAASVTLDRVRDLRHNDEYMMAVFENRYALNTLHGSVVDLQEIDSLDVRESHDMRLHLLQNQK